MRGIALDVRPDWLVPAFTAATACAITGATIVVDGGLVWNYSEQ